ncbi:hypothetical protein FQZ97_932580 [compost metagenome]
MEMAAFSREAGANSLNMRERFSIRHNTGKPVFREVASFCPGPFENHELHEIIIYENDKYSSIFATLLRDYYLIF